VSRSQNWPKLLSVLPVSLSSATLPNLPSLLYSILETRSLAAYYGFSLWFVLDLFGLRSVRQFESSYKERFTHLLVMKPLSIQGRSYCVKVLGCESYMWNKLPFIKWVNYSITVVTLHIHLLYKFV
jgi:hypothetical protein